MLSPKLWRNFPKEYGYSRKIRFPLGIKPMKLTPQQFLDKLFELEGSNEYLIELCKQQKDYRKQCLKIMSEVFELPEQSIRNWGYGFEKMPKIYCKFLGVIYERLLALREIHYQNISPAKNLPSPYFQSKLGWQDRLKNLTG